MCKKKKRKKERKGKERKEQGIKINNKTRYKKDKKARKYKMT